MALLFITLPFVVRAVQPVLIALERDVEEAAESLGARPLTIFRRIILPALQPAILAGVGLAFGRAVGEFGSIVLISGNLPYKTEVASVLVYGQIESDNTTGGGRRVGACCSRSRSSCCWASRSSRAGGSSDEVSPAIVALRTIAHRLPRRAARRPGRDGLLPRVREGLRDRLGRRHHAAGPARVLPHLRDHADRGARQRDLRRDHRLGAGPLRLPRQAAPRRADRPAVRRLAGGRRPRADPRLGPRRLVRHDRA